ncbi:MAG: hypothetical protein ACJ739_03675 [Acidimicrobiales bacterium]
MTKTLDVLVVGSDPSATEEAERNLAQHGHRVHRCHEPGEDPFPCAGMVDPDACPLDQAIDVALLVRRGVHPRPTATEDGVRCAIRAGVPIVEDGSDFYDPFDPWVARRVGPHDDLIAACEAAADRRFDELRTLIRHRIVRLAAAAGTSANEVTSRIEPTGHDLQVDLYVTVPLDARMRQAMGVRVLDAVHASGRTYGQVDVNVHDAVD